MKHRTIDLQLNMHGCTNLFGCLKMKERFHKRLVDSYVARPGFEPRYVSAVIDLAKYDLESYFRETKRVHKGNALRSAKAADKAGFVTHQFVWKNHIPDIVSINASKEVRSGGVMKSAYLRTIEELGGAPTTYGRLNAPACPVHHTYYWGIFEHIQGYMQGSIQTDERLVGYIKFKRNGNFGIYSSILGHGDYLSLGIMYRLHFSVMEWIFLQRIDLMDGLDLVVYGAADSGSDGLKLWKRRGLFEPVMLTLEEE